jgi:hypothetical protein
MIKTHKEVRFHTGTRFHHNEIRRVGEQTSPQVAHAIGLPRDGIGRRIGQWQQLNSPFPFLEQLNDWGV